MLFRWWDVDHLPTFSSTYLYCFRLIARLLFLVHEQQIPPLTVQQFEEIYYLHWENPCHCYTMPLSGV